MICKHYQPDASLANQELDEAWQMLKATIEFACFYKRAALTCHLDCPSLTFCRLHGLSGPGRMQVPVVEGMGQTGDKRCHE